MVMSQTVGKREAKKKATREALQAAAERLFRERGYHATTVREIAEEVGVTERTFFRYFDSKEGLVRQEGMAWLPVLQEVIRSRPPEEPPLVAAREAIRWLAQMMRASGRQTTLTLFGDSMPVNREGRIDARILQFLESGLTDVMRERLQGTSPEHRELDAQVAARVVAGILRSGLVEDYRRRSLHPDGDGPRMVDFIDRGFQCVLEGFS